MSRDATLAQGITLALQGLAQGLGFVFQLTGGIFGLLELPDLGLGRVGGGIERPA
ncbi:hypothetical protein [Xenorhabdus stockiae]|uniref:hypothetical protein n=1 Tax=Xenorhabdus stockiae TaxID=351614 RepID=UPI004062A92E